MRAGERVSGRSCGESGRIPSGEEKREKAVRLYFLMGCRLLLERERMRTTEDILRLLAETAVEGLER